MTSEDTIDYLLDFIKERPTFAGLESEKYVVALQRRALEEQLRALRVPDGAVEPLKKKLRDAHFKALVTPGDCVGISGAQSMGEFSTQATLNTFHTAGLELGAFVTTGVERFQEIINASKNQKVYAKLYFKDKFSNSAQVRNATCGRIAGVTFASLVDSAELDPRQAQAWYARCCAVYGPSIMFRAALAHSKRTRGRPVEAAVNEWISSNHTVVRFVLNAGRMYESRIHPSTVKRAVESAVQSVAACLFCPPSQGLVFDVLFERSAVPVSEINALLSKVDSTVVCGIPGVASTNIVSDGDEWYVECEGGTMYEFARCVDRVDCTRLVTNSAWDVYETLGIEAVREFLFRELVSVMHGVGSHNIQLLVDRMTHGGTISSITRYTLRADASHNAVGPLGSASFEESMGTLLKAARYGDVETCSGASAAIICGRRPQHVGTTCFDVLVDPEKLE